MKIGFENILDHTIPLENSGFEWRFCDDKDNPLPEIHLHQLKVLDSKAAQFLWDYISDSNLHSDIPFKKGFFKTIDKARIWQGNKNEIKKWLYQRALPFDKLVFLSWQPGMAMIVPWKLLVKYFDSFHFGGDDLTVIDQSLNWGLLFYHENEIYFGTNEKFTPNETFSDIFIW